MRSPIEKRRGILRSAAALIETLQRNGIFHIFGLPGSTEAPLLDALLDYPEMHYVLALHEGIVVGMADGFARASGRPAVANLHTTVGVGNGLTALFNAWKDNSPVVTIATHKHSEILGRDGFCVGPDLPEWARPVTKWAWQGVKADQIPQEVGRALKIAQNTPSGPVFLAYPEDMLGMEITGNDIRENGQISEGFAPSMDQMSAITKKLLNARSPICIAGDEVSATGAAVLVERFSELWNIPVLQESRRSAVTWNVATNFKNYAGEYSSNHPLVKDADVIFALGPRLSVEFSPVKQPDVPANAELIHIHRNPSEVGKLYQPSIGLVASVAAVLEELCRGSWETQNNYVYQNWRTAHNGAAGGTGANHAMDSSALCNIGLLSRALARIAPSETAVVDESIRSSPALLANYPLRPGNYFHTSGGGLGWGLPVALGVQLAWPERPVLAYIGDGSLMFTVQALWTAARENLPVKIVVPNNRKYLAVKAGLVAYKGQAVEKGRFMGVDLTPPNIDIVSLAGGFGVEGRIVQSQSELDPALEWAFSHDGPALVDVLVEEDLGES